MTSSSRARRIVAFIGFFMLIAPASAVMVGNASGPVYQLPLDGEPSVSTWYVSQWYGNTVWANRNWEDLYRAGQGLHFGIDFAAPCGTEVVAIGDGTVFAVDGPYGSAPHHVVIDHGDGFLSLYGHLRNRSHLVRGDVIARGDRVGEVGDPAGPQCVLAPHLHLEIRRTGMSRAVNPAPLIDADWRSLTIGAGTEGTRFLFDFEKPGQWIEILDQPEVTFGGDNVHQRGSVWPPRGAE